MYMCIYKIERDSQSWGINNKLAKKIKDKQGFVNKMMSWNNEY